MSRWIKLQYEDFKADHVLLNRLHRFLTNNMHVAHLAKDLATIKNVLEIQVCSYIKEMDITRSVKKIQKIKRFNTSYSKYKLE